MHSYRFTDKQVLCGVVMEEVGEDVPQPGRQPALHVLLQASVLSLLLATRWTGERHRQRLTWQQAKQLLCNHTEYMTAWVQSWVKSCWWEIRPKTAASTTRFYERITLNWLHIMVHQTYFCLQRYNENYNWNKTFYFENWNPPHTSVQITLHTVTWPASQEDLVFNFEWKLIYDSPESPSHA